MQNLPKSYEYEVQEGHSFWAHTCNEYGNPFIQLRDIFKYTNNHPAFILGFQPTNLRNIEYWDLIFMDEAFENDSATC